MKILIGYDGPKSAAAAIAAAGELLAGSEVEAIVLSVWEPESVAAVRAARFGGPMLPISTDAGDDDDRSEQQARKLAEHGARLARNSGFDPTPLWMADDRDVPSAVVGEARELDVDLVVLGARGLAGVRAFLGSVANHVLQHCQRPVLVIPASSPPENAANPEPPAGVGTSTKTGRARPHASVPRTGPQPDAHRAVIPQTSRKGTVMARPIRQKADVLKVLNRAGFPRKTIAGSGASCQTRSTSTNNRRCSTGMA